jgi:hypothetical protein
LGPRPLPWKRARPLPGPSQPPWPQTRQRIGFALLGPRR